MKKLALICGLLFVIVFVWVTVFEAEKDSVEDKFPVSFSGSLNTAVDADATASPASVEGDTRETAGRSYYLIIASYSDIIQARQEADKFRNDYDGDFLILPVTPRGYYRISYGIYSTPEAASAMLPSARQTITPDAWVYSEGN